MVPDSFCVYFSSGGPHRIEELADLELEPVAVAGQRLRCGKNLRRGRAGLAGAALHVGDVGRDLLGALGCLLHVAGNLLGRRALLFHRRRDGRGDLRQSFDGAANLLDRVHRLLRRGLDTGDLLTDLAGRLRGLLGQRLHFGSHHRKAATGFAGAGSLDGGVERQQIGLPGDGVDQFDHVADPARRFRQFADTVVSLAGLVDGLVGHPRRFLHLTADLVDRRGHLFGRRRTDCTLVEASSEAAATMVVSSCERAAVEVSVLAEASSSVDADDTVSTISPTADSKLSASLTMSALRCLAATWSCLTLASASSRAFSSAFSRITATVLARSPISSPRSAPGMTISRLPPAIWPSAPFRRVMGRAIPRKENSTDPTMAIIT